MLTDKAKQRLEKVRGLIAGGMETLPACRKAKIAPSYFYKINRLDKADTQIVKMKKAMRRSSVPTIPVPQVSEDSMTLKVEFNDSGNFIKLTGKSKDVTRVIADLSQW